MRDSCYVNLKGRPKRGVRRLRLIAALLACCLLAGLLSGCFAEGESERLKAGKKLMRSYLAARGGHAHLAESWVDVLRPAADRLVCSDFVRGSFADRDGTKYDFAVNIVSGAVWTSERLPEAQAACVRCAAAELGLDPDAVIGRCTIWTTAPAWVEEREEWPWETAYIGYVVPTDVADMDAWAEAALADAYVRVDVTLACPADELTEDRWSTDDTARWENTEVELFGYEGAAPTQEELAGDGWQPAGPAVRLSPEEVRYENYA